MPNVSKNSGVVAYMSGRPTASFRPAILMRRLESSVLIALSASTPRIASISGRVAGCL